MARRSQYNQERIHALVTALVNAGILNYSDGEEIKQSRELNVANDLAAQMDESQSVTREKITEKTKKDFSTAHKNENINEQLAIIWSILTGENVES